MKKVLIVSPHFPPVNAADMQRARLALPHLRAQGWAATVLAVAPESVEGAVLDPVLLRTYPGDIRVIRVHGLPARFTRWAGIGSLWWRCGRALRRAGDQLLRAEKFDLVFFSTTQFDAFTLGPHWLREFGVPYVLDYQDPWVNDYYRETGTRPPGGALKFWFSQFNARRREPDALRSASGLIAVSAAYGLTLERRYPWFSAESVRTIPFGSAAQDLAIARDHRPEKSLVPFGDGNFHHIYAGRCGPDMSIALTILFRAFKRFLTTHPAEAGRHRFHFIGTDYAPPPLGRFWALPVAASEDIVPYVAEHCYRVPYFDALYYLTHSDALLVVGSNDPTYSASKIFPYLLARRPLITIAHECSQMLPLARAQGSPCCYAFDNQSTVAPLVEKVHAEWFVAGRFNHTLETAAALLNEHSAETMTARLAEVFAAATSRTAAAQAEPAL